MAPPAANQPRRGYPRTFAGFIGALIATFGVIAFVWGLTWFQRSGQPNPTPTVSYRLALEGARSQAPFHVLAPEPPPAGLRATSVDWSGPGPTAAWQLGFLTPQSQFIGLYQGDGPAADFIDASTPARQEGGGSASTGSPGGCSPTRGNRRPPWSAPRTA